MSLSLTRSVPGDDDQPDDLADFESAAVILSSSGRVVKPSTLRRWAKLANVKRWPCPGRRVALPSLSDLLRLHAKHCRDQSAGR